MRHPLFHALNFSVFLIFSGCGLTLEHEVPQETTDAISRTGEGLSDVATQVGAGLEATSTKVGEGLTSVGEGIGKTGTGLGQTGEGLAKVGEGIGKTGTGLGQTGEGLAKVGEGIAGLGEGIAQSGAGLSGVGKGMEEVGRALAQLTAGFEASMKDMGIQLKTGMETTSKEMSTQINQTITAFTDALIQIKNNPPKVEIKIDHGLEKVVDAAENQTQRIVQTATEVLQANGKLRDKPLEIIQQEFGATLQAFTKIQVPSQDFSPLSGMVEIEAHLYNVRTLADEQMYFLTTAIAYKYPENFREYFTTVLSFARNAYENMLPLFHGLVTDSQKIFNDCQPGPVAKDFRSRLALQNPDVSIQTNLEIAKQANSGDVEAILLEIQIYMNGIAQLFARFDHLRDNLQSSFQSEEDWVKLALNCSNEFAALGNHFRNFHVFLVEVFKLFKEEVYPASVRLAADLRTKEGVSRYFVETWESRQQHFTHQRALKETLVHADKQLQGSEGDKVKYALTNIVFKTNADFSPYHDAKNQEALLSGINALSCLLCTKENLAHFDALKQTTKTQVIQFFDYEKFNAETAEQLKTSGDSLQNLQQLLTHEQKNLSKLAENTYEIRMALFTLTLMSYPYDWNSRGVIALIPHTVMVGHSLSFSGIDAGIHKTLAQHWEPLVALATSSESERAIQSIPADRELKSNWLNNTLSFFESQMLFFKNKFREYATKVRSVLDSW